MKKILIPILLAGVAVFTACQREQAMDASRSVAITVNTGIPETRTYIEHGNAGWEPFWQEGDSLGVVVDGAYDKSMGLRNVNQNGRTASFQGTLKDVADGEHTLAAWYPKSFKDGRKEAVHKFILGEQTLPSLYSFDPSQDLLVGKPASFVVENGKATVEEMRFRRIFSVVRVVIDNQSQALTGALATKVSLTAAATLTGRVNVDITTGDITAWENASPTVSGVYANGFEMDGFNSVYLLVNPTTLQAGSALTLDVETTNDNFLVSKTVSLPSEVAFAPNTVTTLRFTLTDENVQDKSSVVTYTWDFSSDEWQAAFAEKGNSGTDITGWNITLNHLTLVSTAKSKWRSNCFQMGGKGSTSDRYFKFTSPADGVLKVWVTNTGTTEDTSRKVVVNCDGREQSQPGGYNCDNGPVELSFDITEGTVIVYPDGNGLRFYKMSYTSGTSIPEDPDNPDEPVEPGENAELECTNPPQSGQVDPTVMYGFAQAAGVTGGDGAGNAAPKVLHFNNGKALQTWLLARTKSEKAGDHSPVTIWLSGTFGPEDGRDFSEAHPWFDVKDVSNLSFYGTDSFVMDRIGIFCVRANNIIIRNINFRQPKANNGADAVSLQNCNGVWVDHCTFTSLNQTKDYEDGSTDVTHESKNVTVSWCHYIKTQKSCLVGHSNSASADASITATFHHNWFDGSSSRHPRVRYGIAHVYNNLFDGCTTYGVGSAYGAKVLVEYNYFDGVQLPTDICTYPAKESNESNLQGKVAGYLYATEDILVNRPAKAKDPYPLTNVQYTSYNGSTITPLTYTDFQPSYSYIVTPAEEVPALVKEYAGYGKLGWTEAPVDVNNGDITEFNGSDDDPTDPDTGDEDEQGGDVDPTVPHTYTICMQNKSAVQTVDGVAGGSFFEASSSVADFSKDYSGSFSIGNVTYNQGFKMDSKGYVTFTASSTFNSTVQFYFVRRKSADTDAKIQLAPATGEADVLESPWDTVGDSGSIMLEKGMSYTIKQQTREQAVILVVVSEY